MQISLPNLQAYACAHAHAPLPTHTHTYTHIPFSTPISMSPSQQSPVSIPLDLFTSISILTPLPYIPIHPQTLIPIPINQNINLSTDLRHKCIAVNNDGFISPAIPEVELHTTTPSKEALPVHFY